MILIPKKSKISNQKIYRLICLNISLSVLTGLSSRTLWGDLLRSTLPLSYIDDEIWLFWWFRETTSDWSRASSFRFLRELVLANFCNLDICLFSFLNKLSLCLSLFLVSWSHLGISTITILPFGNGQKWNDFSLFSGFWIQTCVEGEYLVILLIQFLVLFEYGSVSSIFIGLAMWESDSSQLLSENDDSACCLFTSLLLRHSKTIFSS